MSLGDQDRNVLRDRVQKARERLTSELAEVLEGIYGIHRDGRFEDLNRLPTLRDDAKARETRELLVAMLPPAPETKAQKKQFVERFDAVLRGISFTHLNRLVAFKMMEHRDRKLIKETVGRGPKSRGFLFYLADHPDDEKLARTGKEDFAYQHFLLQRSAELHGEIGVLFDPDDLASRIFPRARALDEVLGLINDEALVDVWSHDEALGWTYQYYTPKELRDKTRKEAKSGPRNSYELAFLNQFYTPEYVVRFLTDNTLGRLWLEMKPESTLRDQCSYLVIRPDEKLPPRDKKDPREIRVLDPACGSGHFLLYAFDLLLAIYAEAWEDPDLGPVLREEFRSQEAYFDAVPRLIVERNLHGIDIDRRATQIATLALVLKAKTQREGVSIQTSGIVCAEPPPGDQAFLEEFKERKLGVKGRTLGRILDDLWEHLLLAGEAGSLLKIETAVDDLVERQRDLWEEQKKSGKPQLPLFPSDRNDLDKPWLDFRDIKKDGDFWSSAGHRIEELFETFASQTEGAEGTRRRLLAQDGVEALRFVEALRQRYDVVLMNPPFGTATSRAKSYVDATYPRSKSDLSTTFVERGVELAPSGIVGVIGPEAGLFRRTLEDWRNEILFRGAHVPTLVHLGGRVLDTAKIRVAAFAIRLGETPDDASSACIRILREEGREARLASAIQRDREGDSAHDIYRVRQSEFRSYPYTVVGYWFGEGIRRAFSRLPPLKSVADVRQGLATADDFRFLRLRWEVSPTTVGTGQAWVPFAKGGQFSPFHDDVHLVVRWQDQGAELAAFERAYIRNAECYGRPGLTYPLRAKRFAPRALPSGCSFGHKGPSIFCENNDPAILHALAGLLNSRPFLHLLSVGTGEAETLELSNAYEVGLLKRIPIAPEVLSNEALIGASARALQLARGPDRLDETCSLFVLPAPGFEDGDLAAWAQRIVGERDAHATAFAECKSLIEGQTLIAYDFGPTELKEIDDHIGPIHELSRLDINATVAELAGRIISWSVGVVVGRWDVRLTTGDRTFPQERTPFDAIDGSQPGALPSEEIPASYPIDIDSDGILVEDDGHSDDVVQRVRGVIRLVWKNNAEHIEAQICEALSIQTLRHYFQKHGNGGFWSDHVSTYFKSKRRAPIYWLLRSSHGSYGVWVYYHRLDKDTLYKVLHERYLLGRIQRCRQVINELRPQDEDDNKPKRVLSKPEEKQLAVEDALLVELEEFEASLREIVELRNERGEIVGYDPDLNDGVLLNAAPLHKVMAWPKKDELEKTWKRICDGELDWSHIAMKYYPDRVREACKTNTSFAIAHGLDGEFFPNLREELASGSASKKKKKKSTKKKRG